MLTNFDRDSELTDGLESDLIKLLYYDLQPTGYEYKSYENSRLCIILEGCKNVTVNNEIKFTYYPGQFILLPPYSKVHMDINEPTKALVIELNDKLIKKVAEKISVNIDVDYELLKENRFFLGDIDGDLRHCLNRLTSAAVSTDSNKRFLLDLYAQELVFNLIQMKGIQQIVNLEQDNPIHKALKYIQDNITEPLTINQLAYYSNMSDTNFCNSFKKVMGITPKEYITNLKMTLAKDMLKDRNVTEVAYDLGYENISHFIALFKKKYGITPKQFKSIGDTPVSYR